MLTLCTVASAQRPTTGTLALRPFQIHSDPFTDTTPRRAPSLVYIPAQSFIMGSTPESPGFRPTEILHRVDLSAYSIGQYEITNAEYCEFLNEEGNQLGDGILWVLTDRPETCLITQDADGTFVPVPGGADRPVVTVSWSGARAYCTWLSRKTGRSYRLPTEAEWECAARAGTQTIWWWGDTFAPEMLHWRGSTTLAGQTVPVGLYPPNPWQLYDTVGNVWEWVLDCTEDDFYDHSPTRDPVQFEDDCWTPGIRGGSFNDGMDWCRPGYRINTWWWGEYPGVGFRVARDEGPTRRRGRTASGPPRGPRPIEPAK